MVSGVVAKYKSLRPLNSGLDMVGMLKSAVSYEQSYQGACMEALDCTYEDYRKAVGFSGLSKIVKTQPDLGKFFRIENGGMRLPTVKKIIRAISPLDQFMANEFLKFSDPNSRLFGENTFVVIGTASNYSVGHLERYCGPTSRKIHVMEYDGNFVTVRGQAGGARKWRVSSR